MTVAELALLVPLFNLVLLLWFAIHSRRWTAPVQAARLDSLMHEVDILKGNQEGARLERIAAQREWLENNDRIWKELRGINARLDCPMHRADCPLNRMELEG